MDLELLSERLTPNEIKTKDFKKTVWGYSPEEVVTFLDITAKLWEKVQKREKDLQARIKTLEETVRNWELRESDLDRIRDKALEDAKKIRDDANEQGCEILKAVEVRADAIQKKTETWLAHILSEVEAVEKQKMNFVTAFKSALHSHQEILNADQGGVEPLSSRLHQFLKTQDGKESQLPS